jgi:UDP-N-acetylglucosamine transferase subunit ALG13
MIFVSVGNATQSFSRLLNGIADLVRRGAVKADELIIQSGSNRDFQCHGWTQREFFSPDEFRELIERADVIVCHGGAGTLHHVFQAGKIPVVMPREKKYGEALDHQLEFVKVLADEGRIIPAFAVEDLEPAIKEASRRQPMVRHSDPAGAASLIADAIHELTQ